MKKVVDSSPTKQLTPKQQATILLNLLMIPLPTLKAFLPENGDGRDSTALAFAEPRIEVANLPVCLIH